MSSTTGCCARPWSASPRPPPAARPEARRVDEVGVDRPGFRPARPPVVRRVPRPYIRLHVIGDTWRPTEGAGAVPRRAARPCCNKRWLWQSYRHRSRHDQFLRRRDGGQDRQGDREQRGRAHHALAGRLHRIGRAAGRPGGQAPGGHQSREHLLRHQAADRPPLHRPDGQEGDASSSPTRSSPATMATPGSRAAARNTRPPRSAPSSCRR